MSRRTELLLMVKKTFIWGSTERVAERMNAFPAQVAEAATP